MTVCETIGYFWYMLLRAQILLLLAAIIWGGAFVAQRIAAQQAGVFLFNGFRFLLGGLVVLPLASIPDDRRVLHFRRVFIAGALLFIASALQQAGLIYTTAANAGFITGLYVVFVPLILVLIFRQRLPATAWIAAIVAGGGGFFLSAGAGMGQAELSQIRNSHYIGDLLELAGAVVWACHVIVVGKFVQKMNLFSFAAGQFLVCGLLNLFVGIILEKNFLPALYDNIWLVLYAGILSVGVAYTLQAYGQKYVPANHAAIVLSTEAVFAAIFGYWFIGESLAQVQIFGCTLIFIAILIAQLKEPRGKELENI